MELINGLLKFLRTGAFLDESNTQVALSKKFSSRGYPLAFLDESTTGLNLFESDRQLALWV